MAILPQPQYLPPFPLRSGHVQTVYPTLFRPLPQTSPVRERIGTPDGDFLDIDWHRSVRRTDRLAVISHGLEGDSRRKHPLGMARHLCTLGWDVICLNFRGCSGVPNRLPRFYHSGVTDDLHTVLTHGLATGGYRVAALIGFSMGGNQTLKYLGEDPGRVPREVTGAAVFSVPCDLAGASRQLARRRNIIYMGYFMRSLREKIKAKARMFPGVLDLTGLAAIRTFIHFDNAYTAPLHGFRDAAHYYASCSANRFLPSIRLPTLLVQAADDPFLSPSCYPLAEAENSRALHLEIPRYGGHVGFVRRNPANLYWSEERVGRFFQETLEAK